MVKVLVYFCIHRSAQVGVRGEKRCFRKWGWGEKASVPGGGKEGGREAEESCRGQNGQKGSGKAKRGGWDGGERSRLDSRRSLQHLGRIGF